MPTVSVIIPCLNEQATIAALLIAIYEQTYPRNDIEVIISDGLSNDQTREVIDDFKKSHSDLKIEVIDNVKKNIPAGLNRAIAVSKGEYILRLDAHSLPYPDYFEKCINALTNNLGDNVGGMWVIRPGTSGWVAGSIAHAASHPFGVGDARYRLGGEPQYVETVPFGSYHRSLLDKIGYYDEDLLTNEDYEFNVRIKKAGGKIWFDPAIRSIYFARSTFRELFKQYFRYGYWKGRMLRRYPRTLRLRQLLPPLLILSLVLLILASALYPTALYLLSIEITLYFILLIIAGIQAYFVSREIQSVLGVPLARAIMHIAWGSSLLWSIFAG
jgi:succinoglycan biosynthesis protein ExoA